VGRSLEDEQGQDMRISKEIAEGGGLTVDQLAAFVQECQRDHVPGDTVLVARLSPGRKLRQLRVSFEREPKAAAPAGNGKPSRSSSRGSD
jgi:hypothetical protein